MPDGFITLVIIVAVALVVLKIIKASVKVMISAVAIAAIVWFFVNIFPTLGVL